VAIPPGPVAGQTGPAGGRPGADPPYVPIRPTGWATHRSPRWALLALAVVLVAAVLVALVHKPSRSERASDLRGFVSDVNYDIESCAAGVSESLTAMREAGTNASDIQDTISIANQGADNCEPANNEQIDDLEQYQVTESLASFHLASVVSGLVNWAAPDAVDVQTDVAALMAAANPQAKAKDTASLQRALRKLDAQRATIDATIQAASKSLSAHTSPPKLPG
jgi:hypothetical protein